MISEVKRTIDDEGLLKSGMSVCVGVSGGADSVCLLDVLCRLAPQYDLRLSVVHVNHGLRGDDADRDEAFVKALCEDRALAFRAVHADVAAEAKRARCSVEEAGRAVRYAAFEASGCDVIAVAHTRSDSVETALFQLARGTSAGGLRGIRAKRGNVIRPLIRVTRKQVEAYLQTRGLAYVTDETNACDAYARNFIRHRVVPALKEVNAAFEDHVSAVLDDLALTEAYLTQQTETLLASAERDGGWDVSALSAAHPALQSRAVATLLAAAMKKPPERRHVTACLALLKEKSGKTQLGADCFFTVRQGLAFFGSSPEPLPEAWAVPLENETAETPVGCIRLVPVFAPDETALDADSLLFPLTVRTRRAGDAITLPKRGVTKTLKKLFNEAHLPLSEREKRVVLESGGRVAWVEGFGADKAFSATEKTTKRFTVLIEPKK